MRVEMERHFEEFAMEGLTYPRPSYRGRIHNVVTAYHNASLTLDLSSNSDTLPDNPQ
jgi:hypothetical protein